MKRILAIALILMLAIPALSGCRLLTRDSNGNLTLGGTTYDVNDRSEQELEGITGIRISAVSDEVTVLSGGAKAVAELKGQCRSTSTPVRLDARREGSELVFEVKYPHNITFSDTRLTVTIPAEYAGSLSVGTVSGAILAESLPFKLQQVKLNAISGGINFDTASFSSLNAGTVSGEITVKGITAPVDVKTISGGIGLAYTAFAATTVTTVSGGVTATIPADAAFRVEFHSISGDFRSSHAGIGNATGGSGFSATAGNGTELIKVNTTSGNFDLND